MLTRTLSVRGHALWTPEADGRRAAPTLLATNERRRAPDSVLMALQVAETACTMAGVDPGRVASVFTSAHGDLGIVDALCRTLATDPLLLSPMRFHHSVHNAASGYFAIGARNHQPSTALAAGGCSFAAGLLEAAAQCAADERPVLLVGCDTQALGPLQSVNASRGQLAVALLLAPEAGAPGGRTLAWALQPEACAPLPPLAPALQSLQANALADALPVYQALTDRASTVLDLPLSDTLGLRLRIGPA